MINFLKSRLITIALIITPIIHNAQADDGLFFAAGVGFSQVDFDGSANIEDEQLNYQARAGYMVNKYFGFEGGYLGFDDFDDNGLRLDINAYSGAAIVNAPLVLFDVYAKGGLMILDADISGQFDNQSFSDSDIFVQPFGSIGAELDLGIFNLYTEYTHVIDSDDLEMDIFTGGIKFEF